MGGKVAAALALYYSERVEAVGKRPLSLSVFVLLY
jgi:hypothetical protein